MLRLMVLVSLGLVLVSPALATTERHIEGLPFVFEHRWGEREDGTEFDRWRAAVGLWNTERLTSPEGEVGRRWWLAPLFEFTTNVNGFTEWSLLWPAPLLRHRWLAEAPETNSEWTALLWLYNWSRQVYTDGGVDLDWRLIPFFEYETAPDGDIHWQLLWPIALFARDVDYLRDGGVNIDSQSLLWLWNRSLRIDSDGMWSHNWHLIPLFLWESSQRQEGDRYFWTAPFPIPLLSFGHDSRGNGGHAYIFPYLRHWEDFDVSAGYRERGWGLLPLFYTGSDLNDQSTSRTFYLFPFVDHSESHSWESNTSTDHVRIFLNWFRHEYDRSGVSDVGEAVSEEVRDYGLIPVTWGWRNGQFDHLHVLPLFFWRAGRSMTAFPFYWHGRDYTFLIPFYGRYERTWNNASDDVPSVVHGRRTQFIMFPLWLNQEWFNERDGVTETRRHILWPLIAWWDSDRLIKRRFLPFFVRNVRTNGNATDTTTVIPPLLNYRNRDVSNDGEMRHSTDVVFPLWWRQRDYLSGELDTQFDMLIPLFGRWRDWAGENLNTDMGLYGLYWRARNWGMGEVNKSQDVLFPFYWDLRNRRENRRQFGIVPLWFQETIGGELRRLSVLWPLIQMRWPDAAVGETENPDFAMRLLWILGGYERWADGDVVIDLLGGPLWQRDREDAESHIRLLWWLYRRDTAPAQEANHWRVLGGLVGYERHREERDLRLLWLPIPLP